MLEVDGKNVFTTLEELVNPKHTALILIDIQNDYCSPGGSSVKIGRSEVSMCLQIPARVKAVLEAARRAKVLIVHICMTNYPKHETDSPAWLKFMYNRKIARLKNSGKFDDPAKILGAIDVVDGTWGWQEVDVVAPVPGEIIVKKYRSSAFIGTNLDLVLKANQIKSVVCVGVVTDGCVISTARDAQFFDYYSIVLRDCVATDKKEFHEAALLIMTDRVELVESSDVMEIWSRASMESR